MDHSACALGACECMGDARLHICLHVYVCVCECMRMYVYGCVRFECVQVCLGGARLGECTH